MFIFPAPTQQTIKDLLPVFEMFNGLCIGYHIDIMDGLFVPSTQGSMELVNQFPQYTDNQLWIHLMVHNPQEYIEQLTIPEESIITFHYEAVELDEAEYCAQLIKQKNMRPSLAINPNTPLSGPLCLINEFDHFLIMAVQPGTSGQPFIQKTTTRLKELDIYRKTQNSHLSLAVDGGITQDIIPTLQSLHVDHASVTSGIFNTPNPAASFKLLQQKKESF
ncbi:hypothetical protein K9K77_00240 [Candidatus Babeliales bacterium]|nr:hypothetical protein [Candidatus Babeliales bacterium]